MGELINRDRAGYPIHNPVHTTQNNPPFANFSPQTDQIYQNHAAHGNHFPQNAHIHQNNPSFANFSPQTGHNYQNHAFTGNTLPQTLQYNQNYAPNANPSPQYTYQNYTPHAHLPPQPIRTAQQSAAPINS